MKSRVIKDTLLIDELVRDVLRFEGGYSKEFADSGNYNYAGELVGTNYGISAKVYSNYLNEKPTKEDMEEMPLAHAIDIYVHNYVRPITDNLGIPVSSVVFPQVFDMHINHGYGNTVKLIQQVLALDVDGKSGPITKRAVKKILLNSPIGFNNDLSVERTDFYNAIISADAKQGVFRTGWLKRAGSFHIDHKQGLDT